jgi:cytochrome subunit of sulfide dehydrogenase
MVHPPPRNDPTSARLATGAVASRWRLAGAVVAIGLVAASRAIAADVVPAGSSSCSGCHPPTVSGKTPVTPLAGLPEVQIVTAMQAFRAGQRPATVMDRIAKGFSDAEIAAIAAWYAARKQ